jgi:putative phosphoribosyl transferase
MDVRTKAGMRERAVESPVLITASGVELPGTLGLPDSPVGLVLFAHGTGSGHQSPRNRLVASELRHAGIATLLFDLLGEREAEDRANVFNISLLAERVLAAARWASGDPRTAGIPIGLFGASTGGAAALVAAAREPAIRAVVSRGGRPDLAGDSLSRVNAPSLLIVGGEDFHVLELNRSALALLRCTRELAVVPGATHVFEEPGTLEQVSTLAARWFGRHLPVEARP